MIVSSIGLTGLIYLVKYCALKFTGWVTGLKEITNTYVFVIFLINKIIGIFLVPFIVILAFSENADCKNCRNYFPNEHWYYSCYCAFSGPMGYCKTN